MTQQLSDALATEFFPMKRKIHDCVDTGTLLALSSGVTTLFDCDCLNRNYNPDGIIYDSATSIFKDTIVDAKLNFKIKMTLNGYADDSCHIALTVPHPTSGNILVAEHDFILYKNHTDTNFEWSSFIYNGSDSDAHLYGFKITITPSADMDLTDRSILLSI